MESKHVFKAELNWSNLDEFLELKKGRSIKNHTVYIQGKDPLTISAAKAFKGDPTKWNPEDLLISSLMSCHMMSFLYVCSQHQVEVLKYEDDAEAILEVNANGGGRIAKVILRPHVTITDESKLELVNTLHQQANALCFIANSCSFEVIHEAECQVFKV